MFNCTCMHGAKNSIQDALEYLPSDPYPVSIYSTQCFLDPETQNCTIADHLKHTVLSAVLALRQMMSHQA